MRHVRLHYLAGYAMAGAIAPYFPEFLRSDRGFDARQIGVIYAASQASIMIAPVALTYLADRRASPRLLALAIFTLAIGSLTGLWFAPAFSASLLLYAAFGFSFAAMIPSLDGFYFAVQRKRALEGRDTPPYHRIRVMGTLGFSIPSLVLLALVPKSGELAIILPVGAFFALAAVANARWLPDPRTPAAPETGPPRVPTLEAARTLFSGRMVTFCLAMALLQVPHMGYYTFYPVHLAETLGLEGRWLGLVSTLGLTTETLLLVAFGWLSTRLGLKNLLVLGAASTALRLGLIALAPTASLAIAANLLHGPVILGTLIAPVIFINRYAGDSFRHSMQGVYAVAVLGPARIGGNLLCGWLASHDTRLAFAVGVVCALVSTLLFALTVREHSSSAAS